MAEAELWAKCGEKGDGDCTEEVEEDDGEDCGSKLETKYGSTEGPEREGCNSGVGGKPHPHAVGQTLGVGPLIGEDSFNSSRLNSVQSINDIPQLRRTLHDELLVTRKLPFQRPPCFLGHYPHNDVVHAFRSLPQKLPCYRTPSQCQLCGRPSQNKRTTKLL